MEIMVKVKVSSLMLDPILVKSDLRLDDALSPILFNLVLQTSIREINADQHGFKLQESFIRQLAYADDVVLLEESQGKLKDIFLKHEKVTV